MSKQARAQVAERLRKRCQEIEGEILTRVFAIADPSEIADPQYASGLRAAVSAAADYGLEGVEREENHVPPVPVLLLAQARLAARNGISLDTVLRRYLAGYTLLGDFLIEEAQKEPPMKSNELKRLLREQAARFDRLLTAVGEEHAREADNPPGLPDKKHTEQIERLLAGELVDASAFAYDFDGWHLGVIAVGPSAAKVVREAARSLDYGILVIHRPEHTVWAWLGTRRRPDPENVMRFASGWPDRIYLALGEPGHRISGWRLTHRQASAALAIARRGEANVVRYAEVALQASIARDDLLMRSLTDLYLAPLRKGRNGGELLRKTLRSYFAAERNASSTAAALGVSRQAVNGRLRAVERLLGRPLGECAAEIEVALKMHELESSQDPPNNAAN